MLDDRQATDVDRRLAKSWVLSDPLDALPEPFMTDTARPCPEPLSAYRVLRPISTRWSDNDVYGHVNNVVYYSWFDTAVNGHLIERGVLDIHAGDLIGLVVQTQCNYFAPLAYPQPVFAGIRVGHLGSSSVRYEVGLFAAPAPAETLCAACGHFVHVYVDRQTRRPRPLPPQFLEVLESLK